MSIIFGGCETCGGDKGVTHPGQIKRFCSKSCRLRRHNRKKQARRL